jgi:hypothetical protein
MDSNTWTHFAALVILAFAIQPAGAEPDASPGRTAARTLYRR